ncbi:hypothetical protein [Flavobacterium aestivum]|uniref:hypothetical protein n=1 Tax=Flavobacterium aestivum TaxID=3003257 RepID=UPI002285D47F|nr:hypothetical protein [Flavobacterium aestivum]
MKTSEVKEQIIISLYFNIPLSLITYITTNNLLISLIVFLLTTFFIITAGLLTTKLGYKRHFEITESEGFKKLISLGFRIEKVNDYVGLNGVYRNYLFDIYYDWLTVSNNRNSKALVLNIYFNPPTLNNNKTDHKRLKEISEKYITSRWSLIPKTYCYRWREGNIMMNNSIGLKNPNYEFISQKMDELIEILKTEKLQPIEREKVIEMRKITEFAHIPEIAVYYKKNIR